MLYSCTIHESHYNHGMSSKRLLAISAIITCLALWWVFSLQTTKIWMSFTISAKHIELKSKKVIAIRDTARRRVMKIQPGAALIANGSIKLNRWSTISLPVDVCPEWIIQPGNITINASYRAPKSLIIQSIQCLDTVASLDPVTNPWLTYSSSIRGWWWWEWWSDRSSINRSPVRNYLTTLQHEENKAILDRWVVAQKKNKTINIDTLQPPTEMVPQQPATSSSIYSTIKVWADEKVTFRDQFGKPTVVQMELYIGSLFAGKSVQVLQSQDGRNWSSVGMLAVQSDGYVRFVTSHWTYFAIASMAGEFSIDNDAALTTWVSVRLTSSISGAILMRVGNTPDQRDLASWIPYSGNFNRNLTASGWVQYVFVEFADDLGNTGQVSDSIILDLDTAEQNTGLLFYVNGLASGLGFLDVVTNTYRWTGFNGPVSVATWLGGWAIQTDGVNDYLELSGKPISNYPFTISVRVRPSRVNVLQSIVNIARTSSTNTLYGLSLNNNRAQLRVNGSTVNGPASLVANRWYHIVGVFRSATNRQLYVNTVSAALNTNNRAFDTNTTNYRTNIWRLADSSPSNYFSGLIDEVRLYGKALNATEILALYRPSVSINQTTTNTLRPTILGTISDPGASVSLTINSINYTGVNLWNGWRVLYSTGVGTNILPGTYNITVSYTGSFGQTGAVTLTGWLVITSTTTIIYSTTWITFSPVTARLTGLASTSRITNNNGSAFYTFNTNGSFVFQFIDKNGVTGSATATVSRIILPLSIFAPSLFDIWSISPSLTQQQLTKTWTQYFGMSDPVGDDSGWYTTISSTALTDIDGTISASNIQFKANTITRLSGSVNPRVVFAAGATVFQSLGAWPLTYIKRDTATNSGLTGSYGDLPTLRANIPAATPVGWYTGILTFTLIEL